MIRITTLIVLAFAATAAFAAGDTTVPPVEPLQPGAGDFLDVNYDGYAKQANDAYGRGDYEAAASSYLQYLRGNVSDANAIYNLACCYGLLGEEELAAVYLRRARRAGFDDVGWVEKDPDFDNVREAPAFAAVVAEMEEAPKGRGEMVYVNADAALACRVFLPEDYDPAGAYTLVLGLHGRGGNAETFSVLWEEGFEPSGFIFAVPEAPYVLGGGRVVGYEWFPDPDELGEAGAARATESVVKYVGDVAKTLKSSYAVGDVYILGFSQGGALAYRIIAGAAEGGFAGAAVFGGPFNETWFGEKELEEGRSARLFIAHGVEDAVVPAANGEQARDAFVAAGYDVTYRPFDGIHNVNRDVLKEAIAWMAR